MVKASIGIAVAMIGLIVWQFELVGYGLMQAKGQVKVLVDAKPIEEFLNNTAVSDSIKTKLRLTQEVRQYAIEKLGINESDSYLNMYDQKGKVSLWNLSACEPFRLEAKTWSFPLLGSFPYKGFFDLEKAKQERDELKVEGYDTRIRPVSGWSTLGWFDDPLLSNMLRRSEGRLAELIIHEMTHGTLYIKDSADYNENLATFVGERGAEQFLIHRYGIDSKEYVDYVEGEKDNDIYISHFIRGAQILDSLYSQMDDNWDHKDKVSAKESVISSIVENIDTLDLFNKEKYIKRFREVQPNNAYFMSFMRYHSKKDLFEEEYKRHFNSDIKAYLVYLKQKYPSL